MDVYDDEWDACTSCGGTDFTTDDHVWERICTSCGITSCYEIYHEERIPPPYYYKHDLYFRKSIVHKAIDKGAPLAHVEDHLVQMFHRSLMLFHRHRKLMKRDNYPSYTYTLVMLCNHLGIDVLPYVKLPKMSSVLDRVKHDWQYIDPTINC